MSKVKQTPRKWEPGRGHRPMLLGDVGKENKWPRSSSGRPGTETRCEGGEVQIDKKEIIL